MRILLTPVAVLFKFNFKLNFYRLLYRLIRIAVLLIVLIKVWFAVLFYAGIPLANISAYFLHLRNHKELVWAAGWVLTASLTELSSELMALLAHRQHPASFKVSEAVDALHPAQIWCKLFPVTKPLQTLPVIHVVCVTWGSPTLTVNNSSNKKAKTKQFI